MAKRLTEEQKERIVQLYMDGLSLHKICAEVGCGYTTINRVTGAMGVPRRQGRYADMVRKRKLPAFNRFTDSQKRAKIQIYNKFIMDGLTETAAARKVNSTSMSLYKWSKELGVHLADEMDVRAPWEVMEAICKPDDVDQSEKRLGLDVRSPYSSGKKPRVKI